MVSVNFFFFKQKTAYEMRISDWSSDVCSSDLKIRIDYESMVTPDTVYDHDVASGTLETLKVQEIPSGYDASQYVTEWVNLPSRDGRTMIPASLVYKKGTPRDGSAPMHLYVYGSYGYRVAPGFPT